MSLMGRQGQTGQVIVYYRKILSRYGEVATGDSDRDCPPDDSASHSGRCEEIGLALLKSSHLSKNGQEEPEDPLAGELYPWDRVLRFSM